MALALSTLDVPLPHPCDLSQMNLQVLLFSSSRQGVVASFLDSKPFLQFHGRDFFCGSFSLPVSTQETAKVNCTISPPFPVHFLQLEKHTSFSSLNIFPQSQPDELFFKPGSLCHPHLLVVCRGDGRKYEDVVNIWHKLKPHLSISYMHL